MHIFECTEIPVWPFIFTNICSTQLHIMCILLYPIIQCTQLDFSFSVSLILDTILYLQPWFIILSDIQRQILLFKLGSVPFISRVWIKCFMLTKSAFILIRNTAKKKFISAVKLLIAINHIQNKICCSHIYIYIYIYIYWKYFHVYIYIHIMYIICKHI